MNTLGVLQIFGMFMESWIRRVSCNVSEAWIMNTSGVLQSKWSLKASLMLQDTRRIHDSMNITKIEFIDYIYIL